MIESLSIPNALISVMGRKITSISVIGTLLFSSIPLFSTTATDGDGADYEAEFVGIESEGALLKGLLFVPEGAIEAPAVIVLHGFANTKESHCNLEYTTNYVFLGNRYDTAQQLCSQGFVVLLYDQRGHGETDGEIDLELMVKDVSRAVTFLQQRPEVDENRIGLMGSSLGGMIACIASGMDEKIKATALWSSPASMEILMETMMGEIIPPIEPLIRDPILPLIDVLVRGFLLLPIDEIDSTLASINSALMLELTIRFFAGFRFSPEGMRIVIGNCESSISSYLGMLSENLAAIDYVGKIAPRPLLIVQGTEDTMVHPENARALYENAGNPTTLVMVEGTNHTFNSPSDKREEVIGVTVGWFLENL